MNNNELQSQKNYLNHQEYLKTRQSLGPQSNIQAARVYNFQYGPDQNFQPVLQQNQFGFAGKVPQVLSQSAVNNSIQQQNNRLSMMRQYSQQQLPSQQQIFLQRSANQELGKPPIAINNFQNIIKQQADLRQFNNSVGAIGALTASMTSRQSVNQEQESPSARLLGLQRESQNYQSASSLLKYQQLNNSVSSFMPQMQSQVPQANNSQKILLNQPQALAGLTSPQCQQKQEKDNQPQNMLDNPKYLQMIIQQQQQQIDLMKALLQMQLQNQQLNMTNFVQLQNQLNQATQSQTPNMNQCINQTYSPSRFESAQPLNSPEQQQKLDTKNSKSHHSSPLKVDRVEKNSSQKKGIQPFNHNSSTISRLDNLEVLSNFKSPSSIDQQNDDQAEGQVVVKTYQDDKVDEIRSLEVLSNTLSFNSNVKSQRQRPDNSQEMPCQIVVKTVKSHDSNYSRNGIEHNDSYLKNYEIQTQSRPLSQLENLAKKEIIQSKSTVNTKEQRDIEFNNSQSVSHSSRRSHNHQKSFQTGQDLNIFHPEFNQTPLQTINVDKENQDSQDDSTNLIQQLIVVSNSQIVDQVVEVQHLASCGLSERRFNQLETIDSVDQDSSKFDTRNISPENTKRTSINFDFALELRQNENLISVQRNSNHPQIQNLTNQTQASQKMIIQEEYQQNSEDKKSKRQSKMTNKSSVEESQNSGDKRKSQISHNSYQADQSKDKLQNKRSPSANRFKKSEPLKQWISSKQLDNKLIISQSSNQLRIGKQVDIGNTNHNQKQILQKINSNHMMPKPMFQSHLERQPKQKQVNGVTSLKSAFSPKSSVVSSLVNVTNPTQSSIVTKQSTTHIHSDFSKNSPSQNLAPEKCVPNLKRITKSQASVVQPLPDSTQVNQRKSQNQSIINQKIASTAILSPITKRQSISRNSNLAKSRVTTEDKLKSISCLEKNNAAEVKERKSIERSTDHPNAQKTFLKSGQGEKRKSLSRQRNQTIKNYNSTQDMVTRSQNDKLKQLKQDSQIRQKSSSPQKNFTFNDQPKICNQTLSKEKLNHQGSQDKMQKVSPLKLILLKKQQSPIKEQQHIQKTSDRASVTNLQESNAFKRKKLSKESIASPMQLSQINIGDSEQSSRQIITSQEINMSQAEKSQNIKEKSETLEFVQLESLVNNIEQLNSENDRREVSKDAGLEEDNRNDKSIKSAQAFSKQGSPSLRNGSRRNTEERNQQIQKLELELLQLREKTKQIEIQTSQLEDQLTALKSINHLALQKNCLDSLNTWRDQQQAELVSMKQSFEQKRLELDRLRRESIDDEMTVLEGPVLSSNRQSQSHQNIQSYFSKINPTTEDLSKKIEKRFQLHNIDSSYSIFNNSTPQNEQSEVIQLAEVKIAESIKYEISSLQSLSIPTDSKPVSIPGSAQNACSPTVQGKQKRVSFKDQELERLSIEKLAKEEFEKNIQIQEIQKELQHLIKDLNKISQEEQIYVEKLYGDTNALETDESRSNVDRSSQSPKQVKQKSQSLQSSPEHIPVVKGNYDMTPEILEEYPQGLNYDELYKDYGMDFPSDYHQPTHSSSHSTSQKTSSQVNLIEHIIKTQTDQEKVTIFYESGKQELIFNNGIRKEIWPDGYEVIYFKNNDIKQIFPGRFKIVYYYQEQNITETQYEQMGISVYRFKDKIQKVHSDGKVETIYPDGKVVTEIQLQD